MSFEKFGEGILPPKKIFIDHISKRTSLSQTTLFEIDRRVMEERHDKK
jgi:hypothetical protein